MKKDCTAICKKILTGALAASMLTYGSVICNAATIEDLDINSGIMEVSGSVSDDEMVLIEVLKGNSAQSNYLSDLIYIYQKNAENGKFEFEFNILNAGNGQTGEFTVRVSDLSGLADSRPFYFYTDGETDGLREAINPHIQNTQKDDTDIAWLEEYFAANKNKLIPTYVPFDRVIENNYTSNFGELYSYEMISTDNASMRKSIRKVSLLTMLGNSSEADIHNLLQSYGADLQISGKQSYITYTQFNEDGRKSVAKMLYGLNRPYTTEKAFIKAFDTAVIITKLGQINGTTACENVLAGYPEYFNISNATINHYKDILKGITDKSISSIDGINNILSVVYENSDNTGSSRPGGGSGSGGGALSGVSSDGANQTNAVTPKPETKKAFTDLGGFEWAVESINYLRDRGIINGYSDEVFAPADNVSRAQLCKMLCLALELHTYDTTAGKFQDVNKSDWYYDYVATLSSLGIVNGTGDNLFEPDKNVTREDMAVMVYRAMQLKNIASTESRQSGFHDKDMISDYAVEAVSYLNNQKLLNGDDKGNFNPKNSASRAETAKFIHSVCIKHGGAK